MKLRGTLQEDQFRAQLLRGSYELMRDEDTRLVRAEISKHFPEFQSAFILDWVPDQGEEFYRVLIDGETVISIEYQHLSEPPKIEVAEVCGVESYRNGLRKLAQIKLAVAVDLAKNRSQ